MESEGKKLAYQLAAGTSSFETKRKLSNGLGIRGNLAVLVMFLPGFTTSEMRLWIADALGMHEVGGFLYSTTVVLVQTVLVLALQKSFRIFRPFYDIYLWVISLTFLAILLLTMRNSAGFMLYQVISIFCAALIMCSFDRSTYPHVLRAIARLFFLYVAISMMYWLIVLNSQTGATGAFGLGRMGSSMFAVVFLGALIPFFFVALVYSNRLMSDKNIKKITPFSVFFYITIASIGSFLTGGRIAVFLVIPAILTAIFLVRSKRKRIILFIFGSSGLLAAIFLVAPLLLTERFGSLSGHGRTESLWAGIVYWSGGSGVEIMFGRGFGQVYPYWQWLDSGAQTWSGLNFFQLGELISIVSPHNSLIWILVEGGLLLFVIYAFPFLRVIFLSLRFFSRGGDFIPLLCAVFILPIVILSDYIVGDAANGQLVFWLSFLILWGILDEKTNSAHRLTGNDRD